MMAMEDCSCALCRLRRSHQRACRIAVRAEQLRVGCQAAFGAGLPGEAVQDELAGVVTQPSGQRAVVEKLSEALPQLGHVARIDQEAGHAWAEAHVDHLGWVGFDISNGISPDERYVRVATGRDYAEAAPVTGMSYGAGESLLEVRLAVEQQHVEQ